MKHLAILEQFKDKKTAQSLLRRIVKIRAPYAFMEVCGTHTVQIFKTGIRDALPKNIRLLSGPGCPVCVTATEDIDKIGDGAVAAMGLAKKLGDPKTLAFLEKAVGMLAEVDLSASKKVGPFGLVSAGFNDEIKEGLGVLMQLTKAMGHLKNGEEVKELSS